MKKIKGFAESVGLRFVKAEIPTRAAALAYHSLLAIVPIVGLCFWYLTRIGVTEAWRDLSRKFILQQLNVSSSRIFLEQFNHLTSIAGNQVGGVIGVVLLGYTMMSLIIKFGESLDVVLGTNQTKSLENVLQWNNAKLFLRRMLVMLGLPIALSLSLAISQWVRKDSFFHHLFDLKSVGPYFAWCFALVADVIVYFFVYFFVPRKKVPGTEALKAAGLAAVLSELTRYFFGVYNSYAVSVHKIYGVLSVIPMFILWVQVAWMVILVSAMVIVLPNKRSRS